MNVGGRGIRIRYFRCHYIYPTYLSIYIYPHFVATLQGKGSMKTYWLLGREQSEDSSNPAHCPFGSILLEELSKVTGKGEKLQNTKNSNEFSEMRSLYSPVSFEDVKRSKSTTNTPTASPSHKSNIIRQSSNNYNDLMSSRTGETPTKDREVVIIRNKIRNNASQDTNTKYPYEYSHSSKTCTLL